VTAGTSLDIVLIQHRAGRLRYLIVVLNAATLSELHVELDGEEILGLTPDEIINDGAGKLSIGTGVANSGLLFCHRNTAGAYGVTLNLMELPEEFNESLRIYLRGVGASNDTLQSAFCLYDLKT